MLILKDTWNISFTDPNKQRWHCTLCHWYTASRGRLRRASMGERSHLAVVCIFEIYITEDKYSCIPVFLYSCIPAHGNRSGVGRRHLSGCVSFLAVRHKALFHFRNSLYLMLKTINCCTNPEQICDKSSDTTNTIFPQTKAP